MFALQDEVRDLKTKLGSATRKCDEQSDAIKRLERRIAAMQEMAVASATTIAELTIRISELELDEQRNTEDAARVIAELKARIECAEICDARANVEHHHKYATELARIIADVSQLATIALDRCNREASNSVTRQQFENLKHVMQQINDICESTNLPRMLNVIGGIGPNSVVKQELVTLRIYASNLTCWVEYLIDHDVITDPKLKVAFESIYERFADRLKKDQQWGCRKIDPRFTKNPAHEYTDEDYYAEREAEGFGHHGEDEEEEEEEEEEFGHHDVGHRGENFWHCYN